MKILVTGGSGFIGHLLIKLLKQQDHDIWMLSRQENCNTHTCVNIIKGDLTSNLNSIKDKLTGFDAVLHCAGEINDTTVMELLHVEGTLNLLDILITEAKNTNRAIHWVQLSSVGAYGAPTGKANDNRTVTENTKLNPIGEYEITKTKADKLLIKASINELFTYTIVRPSNVVSVDMPNQSIRSLGKMVKNGMFFYIGKSGAIASYVHVDDIVELLSLCLTDDRAKGEIFNISNDCLLEKIISGIAKSYKVRIPKLHLPEYLVRATINILGALFNLPLTTNRINALVSRTKYPYSKLETRLGYTPKLSIPESIEEIVSVCSEKILDKYK